MKGSFDIVIREQPKYGILPFFNTKVRGGEINLFTEQKCYDISPLFGKNDSSADIILGKNEQVFDLPLYGHTIYDYISTVPSTLVMTTCGTPSLSYPIVADANPSGFVMTSGDASASMQINLEIDDGIKVVSDDIHSMHSDITAQFNESVMTMKSFPVGLFLRDILPDPANDSVLCMGSNEVDMAIHTPLHLEESVLVLGSSDTELHTISHIGIDSSILPESDDVQATITSYLDADSSTVVLDDSVTVTLFNTAKINHFGDLCISDFNEDEVYDYLYIDESLSSFDGTTIQN